MNTNQRRKVVDPLACLVERRQQREDEDEKIKRERYNRMPPADLRPKAVPIGIIQAPAQKPRPQALPAVPEAVEIKIPKRRGRPRKNPDAPPVAKRRVGRPSKTLFPLDAPVPIVRRQPSTPPNAAENMTQPTTAQVSDSNSELELCSDIDVVRILHGVY